LLTRSHAQGARSAQDNGRWRAADQAALEEMSMGPVEAARTTGASFLSVIIMGALPQLMPRCVGFCAYQFDSNLRNSVLVGVVGGGGIGTTLLTAFLGFDYQFVLTIVLPVIAIVLTCELVSGFIRKLFQ
jgi:phosphonate transport system permease protein